MNEVSIENFVPDSIKPGEKTLVEVVINKSQIQGFAKMEILFPDGFVATPAETNGASFTFSEKKVRFVWMTLPTSESFTVSYYLECPSDFDGKYEVKGNFAYIKENERVDYAIPTKQLFVRPDQSIETIAQNETPAANEVVETEVNSASPSVDATSGSNLSKDFSCERVITKLSDTEYRVDVRVKNSNIKGFAKIVETCPNLSKTEKIQDAGATVTADKNSIKFVWFEIPNSPLIQVSYKFTLLSPTSNAPEVSGKIAFVENNNPKEIAIQTLSVGEAYNEVIANNEQPKKVVQENANSNDSSNTSSETSQKNDADQTKTTSTETVKQKEDSTSSTASNSPKKDTPKSDVKPAIAKPSPVTKSIEPEVGVSYRVQIMAAHRVVNKSYFKQRHGFSEDFNIENHEGWVKYTTGKFGEYKTARNERERLKSDYASLPGPFVTAYNNGDRITVQEALLISKQQWYK